jgi:hypothetical protein
MAIRQYDIGGNVHALHERFLPHALEYPLYPSALLYLGLIQVSRIAHLICGPMSVVQNKNRH